MTNLKDCNGIVIKEGDIVRDLDGFTGEFVFTNGAWRYDVLEGTCLKFNSSLLFKEGIGTSQLKIVAQAEQAYPINVETFAYNLSTLQIVFLFFARGKSVHPAGPYLYHEPTLHNAIIAIYEQAQAK